MSILNHSYQSDTLEDEQKRHPAISVSLEARTWNGQKTHQSFRDSFIQSHFDKISFFLTK